MKDYSKIENIPDVTGVDIAFGSDVALLPKYEDIPQEFKRDGNKWCRLFSQIVYSGGENIAFVPKPEYSKEDLHKVLKFIRSAMDSFSSKHEHKEAAVAYLFSLYWDDWSLPEEASNATI